VDATITEVIDGDTLTVKIGETTETIQLVGVVAPQEGECFFKEATDHAKQFLLNQPVKLGKDEKLDRDAQGRLLRSVWFQKGEMLFNEIVLEFGYALMSPEKHLLQADFEQVQKRAQEKPDGLWKSDTCDGNLQPAAAQTPDTKSRTLVETTPAETKPGCEQKKTCTQMESCEEAYFQLSACGNVSLDQNNDGVPCESLCKEQISKFSCEEKKPAPRWQAV
jgi:endonuclease YncB( thermonuclease family)